MNINIDTCLIYTLSKISMCMYNCRYASVVQNESGKIHGEVQYYNPVSLKQLEDSTTHFHLDWLQWTPVRDDYIRVHNEYINSEGYNSRDSWTIGQFNKHIFN